jgi:hypothetical protein
MYYVRMIANPLMILAFGHGEPGKYVFDPDIYQEVQGELPVGWSAVAP